MTTTNMPSALGRMGSASAMIVNESSTITTLKHKLLLAAIEKSPRLRTDLDLLVITNYLGTLESFRHVSSHVLHYLATECTSMILRDGDVFCYQEDPVVDDSNAIIIIEGSLCGYFNKPFNQRTDVTELFTPWNLRQNRKRGVLVDFGDFQTTYTAGALCGFDDLLVGVSNTTSSGLVWHRCKGIHAQEQTQAICIKKDTLDRAAHRFGLAIERGLHHRHKEAPAADISHIAVFSTISDATKQALLQHAPRRVVLRGDTLFSASRDKSTTTIISIAIVLSGRLDVYWTGEPGDSDQQDSDRTDLTPTSKNLLFSIRRGQTIGDQSIGLALDRVFHPVSPQQGHTMQCLPIRIQSGDDTTEVMLISAALYKETCMEDFTLQDYSMQLQHERQCARQSANTTLLGAPLFCAWASEFFASTPPVKRTHQQVQQLLWRLRVDPVLSKVFFQFPPLVLERLCHAMGFVQFNTNVQSLVLDEGREPDVVYVVVHGAMCGEAAADGTHGVYLPGDLFGLTPCTSTAVYADADTMLLTFPRTCVERWLQPVKHDLILNAGSLFHRHAAFTAAHPPHHSLSPEKRRSLSSPTRRASARALHEHDGQSTGHATAYTDGLATLLQRMGVLMTIPHFLLRELLLQCTIVHKPLGQILCHENESSTMLVVLLSGFLRVFSLEHLGVTIDMFRGHVFCHFASLHHVLTKQQSELDDGTQVTSPRSGGDVSSLNRNRSAMYGIQLQTLHANNAFRTGVLNGHTECPATIVAQTACTLLMIDEATYTQMLRKHTPGIDLASYQALVVASATAVVSGHPDPLTQSHTVTIAGEHLLPAKLVPQPLVRHLEAVSTPLAWFARLSSAKRQLVIRSAKVLMLQPGDRLLRQGNCVDHVFFVVSGVLALYVRHQHDRVANAMNASQRSVRSLMLERHVTSNYSTTSHQLSSLDATTAHGGDRHRLQRKRALLQHKVQRLVTGTSMDVDPLHPSTSTTNSSLFVQSVIAAVRQEKQLSAGNPNPQTPGTSPRKLATKLAFHAAVSRAALAHRVDQQRSSVSSPQITTSEPDGDDLTSMESTSSSTFLCHLHVGDVLGEEALSSVVYRSPCDVFADTPSSHTNSATALPSIAPTTVAPIEILCLDRVTYRSILQKTNEEAEQELRGRSRAAKSKWHLAEKIVTLQKRSSSTHLHKTPKLFDLFENILNQRYYITMRALAEISLLQDLSDAVKQELCAGARFEAIERFTNVYKDDIRSDPTLPSRRRYYFVLSGRIGLFARSGIHGNVASGSGPSGTTTSSSSSGSNKHGSVSTSLAAMNPTTNLYAGLTGSMESCLQEVTAGHGFGELEILVPEASRQHMLAVALETTKLLSLPADVFVKHWPQVPEMERHIAYLRNGNVRFFARLEIEKIASLYHALRTETYERGARVLEQQAPLQKSEVVFFKDGECSLKATIGIETQADPDDSTRRDHEESSMMSPKKSRRRGGHHQAIRVQAMIADVRSGHVFWLDGPGMIPFSLQAISSRVEIARITVDKLRAVLPKAHLAQLEDCSNTLAELQREQLANAQRMIVRVMNAKRNAELGRSTSKEPTHTFLPTLHYTMQATTKMSHVQSLVQTTSYSSDSTHRSKHTSEDRTTRHELPAIPFARVLASKPVDLGRIHADDRTARQQQDEAAQDDGEQDEPMPPQHENELEVAYRTAHQHEHYQLTEGAVGGIVSPASMLRGSFPDDPTLCRRRRLAREQSHGSDSLSQFVEVPTKIDEIVGPETIVSEPVIVVPRTQLQVTLPSATRRDRSKSLSTGASSIDSPMSKPRSAASTKKAKSTVSVDYYGDPAEWEEFFGDRDDNVDFVVDLRAMLDAEMQAPLAPLRSIKLAPSGSKLHSMGKYIDAPREPTRRPLDNNVQPPRPSRGVLTAVTTPRILPSGWKPKPPTQRTPTRPPLSTPRDAITHKHGLLWVLRVPPDACSPGFAQDDFLLTVVHRQKRRLMVLDDTELREYADDTRIEAVNDTTRVVHVTQLKYVQLSDAPVVTSGENEEILRQSFLLSAQDDVVLFTCTSPVDKTAWMEAIRIAAKLGKPAAIVATAVKAENGSPGSPKFKHRASVATSVALREARRGTMAGTSGSIVQEEVLEVEYRIS